jgi:ribosomal protein S28E/S33
MFFDIRRKVMGPIVFGDEIEIRNRSRVKSSMERVLPWVTDGGRGKPVSDIGIIGGRPSQIFFGQISVKILNSIDHCRIALEGDLSFKTIMKNG